LVVGLALALLSGCAANAARLPSLGAHVVYITSLEHSATSAPNVLSALDAITGKLLWRFHPANANVNLTTAVPGRDVIYVGATDQSVYALAKGDGQARWHVGIGGFPTVEAVVGDAVIVMATSYRESTEYNVVSALNTGNGRALWRADLQRGVVRAIAAGKVYVETSGQDQPAIIALDIRSGEQLWQYPLGRTGAQWQLLGSQIYIQTSPSRDPLTSMRLVISATTGKPLWRFPSSGEAVIWGLRVGDGHVYLAYSELSDGQSAAHPSATLIAAFDPASGALQWQQYAPANASALVGAGNGSLYTITGTELVALRAEKGTETWRAAVGRGIAGLVGTDPTVAPGAIYAAIMGTGLVKFNAADGSQAWHIPTPRDDPNGFTIVTVNLGVLYASELQQQRILAFDTATGKVLWRYDVAASIAEVTVG
jgi:outer membrane protein assembly factor BamB